MPAHGDRGIREQCEAYARRMPEDQFFAHATAAVLHGLPLPRHFQDDTRIHVAANDRARAVRMRGVISHRLAHAPTCRVDGLTVMTPMATWTHLSGDLDFVSLVAMGDALVRREHPPATMDDLELAAKGHRGKRGALLLRQALASVRPGVDSPMETKIRLMIVRAGLPEPEVNARILNQRGAFIALGDMVYPRFRVLVEYDGGHHFESVRQAHHDIDRLDAVMEERWRVIRLNRSHLQKVGTVVHKVRTALTDAGWHP